MIQATTALHPRLYFCQSFLPYLHPMDLKISGLSYLGCRCFCTCCHVEDPHYDRRIWPSKFSIDSVVCLAMLLKRSTRQIDDGWLLVFQSTLSKSYYNPGLSINYTLIRPM